MFNLMRQWFYISTECQADLRPFIQGHSFGLPHRCLNIYFSEITWLFKLKSHMKYFFDGFGHLAKMVATPYMVKPKYVSMISLS